jgi:thiamine-phosphate pyrophosphorylase
MLVTDRHQLVARTGADPDQWQLLLTAQIRGAVAGGIDLVQVREPDLDSATLSRFLGELFEAVPGSQERVVVNDRGDLARRVGARGVHLKEASPAYRHVAADGLADKRWVTGRSVHGPGPAADSGAMTYLLAGTVAASPSKPAGWTTLGWSGLKAVVDAAGGRPVLAIGGLSVADIPSVVRSGAAGLAGISLFIPQRASHLADFVQHRVGEMRLGFDSLGVDSYTEGAGS